MNAVSRLIVLLTDFGYRDPYVGVMKGVIKKINPHAEIIDLTHGISRQNVLEAAVILLVSRRYFPEKTIFVCVVDPGVGTSRRAIVMETKHYTYVGPDNGCLALAAEDDGIVGIYDVSESEFTLKNKSYTFHGRDVFAPIAAYLSLGYPPESLGYRVDKYVRIDVPSPQIRGEALEGRIVYIDVFGNAMTNIYRDLLEKTGITYGDVLNILHGAKTLTCKFVPSFGYVEHGETACYINSWGYLEIGVNHGNASQKHGLRQLDKIVVEKT